MIPCLLRTTIGLLSLAFLLVGCGNEKSGPPLSVLLITLDTTRADRIGVYGHQTAKTPHIDRLAQEGAVFENAIAPVPLTLPSHATLMTGVDPPAHGVRENGNFRLVETWPTLAESFAQSGRKTAAFVSAYALDEVFGLARGFELYDDEFPKAEGTAMAERPTEKTAEQASTWIAQRTRNGESFFCWVHFFAPHFPYTPPAPIRSRVKNPYDGEIAYVDEQVGLLRRQLEETGRLENTLVVIVADHGESLGDHGEDTHGLFVYDSCMKVPLIMRGPGIDPNRRVEGVAAIRDIAPTVLDLAGIEVPSTAQGTSLREAVKDGRTLDRVAYVESKYSELHFGWSALSGLRTEQYKFVEAPRPELFDIVSDPQELHDIADEHPEIVANLRARLEEHIRSEVQNSGSAAVVNMTPQMQARLASLGYLTSRSPSSRPDRPNPKDLLTTFRRLNRLLAYVEQGRVAERIAEARYILREDPNNPIALEHLGVGLASVTRSSEALEPLTRALELGRDTVEVHYRLGVTLMELGNLDLAENHLRRGKELSPDDPILDRYLGIVCELSGRDKEAIEHFREFLKSYRGDPKWIDPIRQRLEALEANLAGKKQSGQ